MKNIFAIVIDSATKRKKQKARFKKVKKKEKIKKSIRIKEVSSQDKAAFRNRARRGGSFEDRARGK